MEQHRERRPQRPEAFAKLVEAQGRHEKDTGRRHHRAEAPGMPADAPGDVLEHRGDAPEHHGDAGEQPQKAEDLAHRGLRGMGKRIRVVGVQLRPEARHEQEERRDGERAQHEGHDDELLRFGVTADEEPAPGQGRQEGDGCRLQVGRFAHGPISPPNRAGWHPTGVAANLSAPGV